MKKAVRDLVVSTLISMGIAMMIFCLLGVVFDVRYGGNFSLHEYRFTKMVIGCLCVGIGFGVPSLIYQKDRLPMPLRVIIHLGIGEIVYFIVAYAVGWFAPSAALGQVLLFICLQACGVLLIWYLFFLYYKKEAETINKKLSEKNL